MKNLLLGFALLSTLPTIAQAYDCDSQPYANEVKVGRKAVKVINVGQISVKNAKDFIASGNDGDFSSVPELREISTNVSILKNALQLGIKIQKAGNDSFVRNVDALVFIQTGETSNDQYHAQAYQLMDGFKTAGFDYYDGYQYLSGVRTLATLRLFKRNDEANDLYAFLSDTKAFKGKGGKIQSFMSDINFNGKIKSKKASVELCEKIKSLK